MPCFTNKWIEIEMNMKGITTLYMKLHVLPFKYV